MLCSSCQTDNPSDARFCYRCGQGLSTPVLSTPVEDASDETSGTLLKIEPGTPDPAKAGTDYKKPGEPRGDAPAPPDYGSAGADNRYRLLDILGRGGMGAVYRAHDTSLDRVVALKRIKQSVASEEGFQRFTREAQSFAKMLHPNIVTLFDYGRDSSGPYLVMEFVAGEPLNARIARRGALPAEQAVGIFEGICAGVMHAHEKGVVHRDIKPANVIIDRTGTPKLLDFGLARAAVDSDFSQTGFFLGTHDYAAPEQKRDAKNVDSRADIYSMGATLYEMLTGLRPVPLHLPKLSTRWQEVVARACEPEPDKRYADVKSFLEAVHAVPLESVVGVPSVPPERQFNELACPECGTENPLDATACSQCKTPLTVLCAVCSQLRRVGPKACNHCGADVVAGEIAASHRKRAEEALTQRRLRDAQEELNELNFLLMRSSEHLGAAAEWFPWVRQNHDAARRDLERARRLAEKARAAEGRGMLAAATEKLAQAARIDASFQQEYEMLAKKAGIAPEQRVGRIDDGRPGSSTDPRAANFDELTKAARFVSGTVRMDDAKARTGSEPRPTITRGGMKVKCDACGAGFLTRQEVIEKQKSCPKCGTTPFRWMPV
ncbi:MAG: protein kinase [Planctomycetes bacterium]|nr:protein kinase [Planctomycetota bacterium]